ncbi:vwfa domain protein [Caudoviricetes sp.]|nr:vwfa domain protein [Caudoviricetes sp.]
MPDVPKRQDSVVESVLSDVLSDNINMEDMVATAEAASSSVKRYVIMLDATGSMGSWWSATQNAVRHALSFLESHHGAPTAIKIVAYRDRVHDDDWIQASDWSGDKEYLANYAASIHAHGGGDMPESIDAGLEVCLNDAQQNKVDLAILIGDAPCRPEASWQGMAQALGQASCPVYAFYCEQGKTKEHFETIAKLSGGKSFYLGNTQSVSDALGIIFAKNQGLLLEYQPMSIEGQRLLEAMK